MPVTTLRSSVAVAVVAAGAMLLLAPASLGSSGRVSGDNICTISSSSKWRQLDSDVNSLGSKVSAAFSGGSVSDGVSAAKSIASKIRGERDLLAKASGSKKLKDALVTLYDRAAVMYDRLGQKLPTIAPFLANMKKNPGDLKSMNKVMDAMASVLQPAAQALQKTGTIWSDAMKGCH